MQLKNVKISNLISFPYVPNLEKTPGIDFTVSENGSVHTLIGPNGSGKTSFLEILNQVLKVGLAKDYVFDRDLAFDPGNDLKKVVTENPMKLHYLQKNFFSEDKPSEVILTLTLEENDYDNLGFLCKFGHIVNEMIEKYSNLKIAFPTMDMQKLRTISELKLSFSIDMEKKAVVLDEKNLKGEEKFILSFVQQHELIQICMNIYDEFERHNSSEKWYPLKNTYAILGSNRHFGSMVPRVERMTHFSARKWSAYVAGQNTKTYYSVSIGYYLCLMKLGELVDVTQECDCIDDIYATEYFQKIAKVVRKYLYMDLVVGFEHGVLHFKLKDSYDHVYNLDELSSGDQSMLLVILTIFGYDMQNGLLIIDEPELHLHPQMQKEFIEFIGDVSEEYALQIILATHSPLMINEQNIRHVYRFSKHDLKTQVNHPSYGLYADEAELVHMLKFENIAKIFFVDKIIMVEGETDAYFFEYYLKHLKATNTKYAKYDAQFEFLNINGKGGVGKWKHFLQKFGIQAYFIGDWDNIVDQHIISQQQMNHYRKLAHGHYSSYVRSHGFLSKRKYGVMVETIKKTAKSLFDYIVGQIDAYYKKDIFFLKKGDLETYMGMSTKGLDDTIRFCEKHFDTWLSNPQFNEHRKELNQIFEKILSDK